MSVLLKVMIKDFGSIREDVCELDQAGYLFNLSDKVVVVDGQKLQNYNDLIQLAARDKYKNKEYIEAVLLSLVAGG